MHARCAPVDAALDVLGESGHPEHRRPVARRQRQDPSIIPTPSYSIRSQAAPRSFGCLGPWRSPVRTTLDVWPVLLSPERGWRCSVPDGGYQPARNRGTPAPGAGEAPTGRDMVAAAPTPGRLVRYSATLALAKGEPARRLELFGPAISTDRGDRKNEALLATGSKRTALG